MRVRDQLLRLSQVVVLEPEKVQDCGVYGEVEYGGGEDALESGDDWEESLKPEDSMDDGWAGKKLDFAGRRGKGSLLTSS